MTIAMLRHLHAWVDALSSVSSSYDGLFKALYEKSARRFRNLFNYLYQYCLYWTMRLEP